MRLLYILMAPMLATLPGAAFADDCSDVAQLAAGIDYSRGIELTASGAKGREYRELFGECDRTNTFNGTPLKRYSCKSDKNNVRTITRFSDGTVVFSSKIGVDVDGAPVTRTDRRSASNAGGTSPMRGGVTLNAEDDRFIVLPQSKGGVSFTKDSGLALGSPAVVLHGERCSIGIVGDRGPYYRLGEASVRIHEDLGNPQCAVQGEHPCSQIVHAGDGRGLSSGLVIVFPVGPDAALQGHDAALMEAATRERTMNFLRAHQKQVVR